MPTLKTCYFWPTHKKQAYFDPLTKTKQISLHTLNKPSHFPREHTMSLPTASPKTESILYPPYWKLLSYPPFLVAALWFVGSVPPSYLAGVMACPDEDSLAPSFRRNLASKQATNPRNYIFQAYVKNLVWVTCEWPGEQSQKHPCIAVVGP